MLYERTHVVGLEYPWRLACSERLSTDFYITDLKSGIRAHVKAGPDSKLIPLICESTLVQTTQKCRNLSSGLGKWLRERNFSGEARLLRLEQGFSVNGLIGWLSDYEVLTFDRYVKEGNKESVMGMLGRNNVPMIVHPQDIFSTGCLAPKLLPVDIEGPIIGIPKGQNSKLSREE